MSARNPHSHPWRRNNIKRWQGADFEWKLVESADGVNATVLIVDLDQGNISVTNDIGNVLATVAGQLPRRAHHYRWFYRDSTGAWDRLEPVTGRISAGPRDGSMERAWIEAGGEA